MEHTIPLQTISTAWMDALKASTRVQEYCKSHYGRSPVLITVEIHGRHRMGIIARILS